MFNMLPMYSSPFHSPFYEVPILCCHCLHSMLPMSPFHATHVSIPCYPCLHSMLPKSPFHATHVSIPCYPCPHSMLPMSPFHATHVSIPCYPCPHSMLPMSPFHATHVPIQCYPCLHSTVRAVLGLLVCLSFSSFRRAVEGKLGTTVGGFLTVITACQFHFLFYASRPLPNTFALILGKKVPRPFFSMEVWG